MVHMHYTQPLKIKFGTNHFFGLETETLVPIQYRERVNTYLIKSKNVTNHIKTHTY